MRKSIVFVSAAVALLSAASCTRELIEPLETEGGEKITITLSLEGDATKTALEAGKTVWAEGDSILFSDGKTTQKCGVPAEFEGKQYAEIKIDAEKIASDTLCAVYPASAFASYTRGGAVSVNVANDQSGLFEEANICVAVADNYQFAMKNVTAVMKVTVPEGIETVMLTASATDTLAGKLAVTYGDELKIVASSALKSIKVPTAGLEGDYYVAVVPGTYKGFSMMALTLDGKTQKKTTEAEHTLAVNELVSLGTIGDDLSGSSLAGTGTADDPFLMRDLADMTTFATMVSNGLSYEGQYIKLQNDIDNVSMPIGTFDQVAISFCGTFDGNNKTVTLAMGSESSEDNYLGLFGSLGAGCVVKDLTIDGTITTNGYYVGGLAAYSQCGKTISSITNVTNKATIKGKNVVGGLFGYIAADVAGVLTVDNCHNTGAVTSTGYTAAGISGYSLYTTIKNCDNTGAIESQTGNGAFYSLPAGSYVYADLDGKTNVSSNSTVLRGTGGIAGVIYNSPVSDCINNGVVTGVSKVGGVVGLTYWGAVTNCKNNVAVTASGEGAGGIVGMQWVNGNITGCTNDAQVSAKAGVGGIVGVSNGQERSSSTNMVIKNDINNGKVISTGKITLNEYNYGFANSSAAGGIVGIHKVFNKDYLNLRACTNNGEVTGEGQAVGGILGYMGNPRNGADWGDIDGCVNNGKVYSGTYRAGGIAGILFDRFTTAHMAVRNCVNYGTVTAPYVVGGIVGWLRVAYPTSNSNTKLTIYNCINRGDVEYTTETYTNVYTGGIVGYMSQVDVQNCWGSTTIIPTGGKGAGTHMGLLFGQAENYNTISNCYSDYDETGYNAIQAAEGVVAGVLYGSTKGSTTTFTDIAMINLDGIFDTAVTVGTTSCSEPLTALNTWATAKSGDVTYTKWVEGENGPEFAK